jgi:hypothetical protein
MTKTPHIRLRLAARTAMVGALVATAAALVVVACTTKPSAPSSPSSVDGAGVAASTLAVAHTSHAPAADQQRGYLDGWFEGAEVNLFYTKWYFCEEPPESGAASGCVIGAEPEVAPRPGPIPTIYAIAAVGFQPDPSTLACAANSACLNHPAMIDASRVVGTRGTNIPALPHSHILEERRAGWFKTVNIRVFRLDVWNQIAAARSLAKVRELQADPAVGGAGLISPDTPTNIFFFIASWRSGSI